MALARQQGLNKKSKAERQSLNKAAKGNLAHPVIGTQCQPAWYCCTHTQWGLCLQVGWEIEKENLAMPEKSSEQQQKN